MIKRLFFRLPLLVIYVAIISLSLTSCASTGKWRSEVVGQEISFNITEAPLPLKDYKGDYVTVVYLENLAIKKMGQNSNKTDVAWLLNEGYRVIELDYVHNTNAIATTINKDIIAINDALEASNFCGLENCSRYQSYILFEGYRISRNVPYFKDDPSVYNFPTEYKSGDMLNMDVVYPANPLQQVPVILSFSYSNSYATFDPEKRELTDTNKNKRTYLKYTFAGFDDSLLEGAPAHGMAWAIADHPKYCPWGDGKPVRGEDETYKSYEVNPDTAQKVKSAIRTLRSLGNDLGLSGNIGIYGFSRGATAGSMAIGDRKVPGFENAGFHMGVSDTVQAAILGPGVFDYTQIYNVLDDGDSNLETRCPWAWGDLKSNYELWQTMGSSYLVQSSATAPVLFFHNTDDDAYYHDQYIHLKAKLDMLQVPNKTLLNYGTGHAVPQKFEDLNTFYDFFASYLNPPSLKYAE